MVTYTPTDQRNSTLFETPFERGLDPTNRWIILSKLTPWDDLVAVYRKSFTEDKGRPSVDLRIIIGTLFVQYIENLADERVIPYIQENIYVQAFLGLPGLQVKPVFDPSLLVTIRKRLGEQGAKQLNAIFIAAVRDLLIEQKVAAAPKKRKRRKSKDSSGGGGLPDNLANTEASAPGLPTSALAAPTAELDNSHRIESTDNAGTLILDATVSPANIAYPTDTALVNECRLSAQSLIDLLYDAAPDLWRIKPRTYRKVAHTAWLAFAKSRKKTPDQIITQLKASLAFVKRDITTVNEMLNLVLIQGRSICWKPRHWRRLWVLTEVYRQQHHMYTGKTLESALRVVSLHQPHIRAIKRGKSGGRSTEFGPKYNASLSDGLVQVELTSFNNISEADDLPQAVEAYRAERGHFPEFVLGDGAYFTRKNRQFLAAGGILHNGVPLGPKKKLSKYEKAQGKALHAHRQAIEGKFGELKTRYGLGRICAQNPLGQLAELSLSCLAANAGLLLRALASVLLIIGGVQEAFLCAFYSLYERWCRGAQAASTLTLAG